MHIHSPASGRLRVLVKHGTTVARGDKLFEFGTLDSDLELGKVNMALSIVERALAHVETVDTNENGPARLIEERAASAVSDSVLLAMQTVLEVRRASFDAGRVSQSAVVGGEFLLSGAALYGANACLALERLKTEFRIIRTLAPILKSYLTALRADLEHGRTRLSVVATSSGVIDLQHFDAMNVVRGEVLATYRPKTTPAPSVVVRAPATGFIDNLEVDHGASVARGTRLMQFSQAEEQLQLQLLSFHETQLRLAKEQVSGTYAEQQRAALIKRQAVLRKKADFKAVRLEETKHGFEVGVVDQSDVNVAQAEYDDAQLEYDRGELRTQSYELMRSGIAAFIDEYQQLIALHRRAISEAQARKLVASEAQGRLVWYVCPGSYVVAGTPLYGIMQ